MFIQGSDQIKVHINTQQHDMHQEQFISTKYLVVP